MSLKVNHLGIIMDGNRRWAKARNLPSFKGHEAGYKKVEEVLNWCREKQIKILTLYSFSTENWQRPEKEVKFLMKLFELALYRDIKKLHQNNVCLKVIGQRHKLPLKVRQGIIQAEKLTRNNTGGILNLAINYGGRQELVSAFNKILKKGLKKITPETITKNLYTAGLPDPDLIIRTSGEQRLSGFLIWQSAYSELLFIKPNWPEFSQKDFNQALTDFNQRQRRFGK
jgi:undecaprenyl diphosphate synthase